ncbi:MAG: isoprenylcysteine carboxylmethyltransferase family protein [Nitrospirae bacterium]|nr:isoprenylcysteine carboxylmethyltransferase family protein [Nitrospirota bacterium]
MNALELKIPPLALVLVLAGAMWFAAKAFLALAFSLPWRDGLAATVSGFGILVILAGLYEFQKAKTTFNPMTPDATSSVVMSGIYRVSRNPMYLGFLLVLIGWAIWLSHPLPFLFLPVFVAYMNRFQVLPEERVLSAKFGEDYDRYKQTVRRWL